MKKRKLGKKCLVRAVTLWDTPEFRAGADCHGISRFQSERVCPEWGGWHFFPDSSLLAALLPIASTCMELTLPARPLRLVFQEETQRPGGVADCRLEIRRDRAAHFTANSDSEGAPAGREKPFTASPLPNASMPNAIVGGSTAPSVVPRALHRLWKPWCPSLPS